MIWVKNVHTRQFYVTLFYLYLLFIPFINFGICFSFHLLFFWKEKTRHQTAIKVYYYKWHFDLSKWKEPVVSVAIVDCGVININLLLPWLITWFHSTKTKMRILRHSLFVLMRRFAPSCSSQRIPKCRVAGFFLLWQTPRDVSNKTCSAEILTTIEILGDFT